MKHTNQEKSMVLGELYRELRIARGFKLKDVARENLSLSQLSRFENGQTMLSADRLLLAIEGIHMSFAEFAYAFNDYELSDFYKFLGRMWHLFSQQDLSGLKALLSEYEAYDISDRHNRINVLIIKDCIVSLDEDFKVASEDIEFLTTYLYEVEAWTGYELIVFGNTTTLLSSSDLVFLGKALMERIKVYSSLPLHDFTVKTTILNIISVMLDRRQLHYARYFIQALEEILSYQDVFAIANLTFCRLLVAYLAGEAKTTEALEAHIAALRVIGSQGLADFFQSKLADYI